MILSLSAILPLTLSDHPPKAAAMRAVSNYLDEIEQLEKTAGQDASVAEAYDIIRLCREKACNAGSVQNREQGPRSPGLLDDTNTTTPLPGYQIDNVQQNLEGARAHTTVSPLTVANSKESAILE